MTPRYTWTPASEPPDTNRDVLVWFVRDGKGDWSDGSYMHDIDRWSSRFITHWRDVEPPEAGE